MSSIKFSDGVEFDTGGESYSLTRRKDGWYVCGKGLLAAVNDPEEGRKFIDEMNALDRDRMQTEQLRKLIK